MSNVLSKNCLIGLVASLPFFGLSDVLLAEELNILSWGGAYVNAQKRAFHEPYLERTGVKIVQDESATEAVAKLRAMNESGNVTWDLVSVVAADAVRLCDEGLALEIDTDEQLPSAPDGTPASEDFGDFLVSDCFIPESVFSTTMGYRKDLVGDKPPTDICAIFDLENYPGKRSLEQNASNNLEWALICDGVAKEQVYDVLATAEGQDRALAKLSTIQDSVVWWTSSAETPQLLADGEVIMGSTYNELLFSAIEEQNLPVEMLWDEQVINVSGWIIPAGLSEERQQLALDYIAFATDTQRLADHAKYVPYSPARSSSVPLVGLHAELGIEMAPHMPANPENASNTILYNYEFWANYRDDIGPKFQNWIEQDSQTPDDGDEFKAKVRVMFGTTRERNEHNLNPSTFETAKLDQLRYGELEVWVPSSHVIGSTSKDRNWFEIIVEAIFGDDNAEDFHLHNLSILTTEEFSDRIAEGATNADRTGFVYIHGFATTFEFAAQRTAQIAYDLQPYRGVPMFFSWPSRGKRTPQGYSADENMVEVSRNDLAEFLINVLGNESLDTIHIIAHSMGARLFAEAIEEVAASQPEKLNKLGEVVLAAPDISALSFERNFLDLFSSDPAMTTIYVSDSDWALQISDGWHGGDRASSRLGEMAENTLMFDGIDTIDISDLNGSFEGHSVVQQNRAVLSDLFNIFSHRLRPERRCCLEVLTHREMHYWKLKGD